MLSEHPVSVLPKLLFHHYGKLMCDFHQRMNWLESPEQLNKYASQSMKVFTILMVLPNLPDVRNTTWTDLTYKKKSRHQTDLRSAKTVKIVHNISVKTGRNGIYNICQKNKMPNHNCSEEIICCVYNGEGIFFAQWRIARWYFLCKNIRM